MFDIGTNVTLSQSATTGSFVGWTNDCNGVGTCSVMMTGDHKVGALFGTKGEVLWAKQLASSGPTWGHSNVATADAQLVSVGQFAGTMQFDTVTLQSPDTSTFNSYVAKFDGLTGDTLWGKSFPFANANVVATDGEAIYVLGQYTGTLVLGNSTFVANGDFDLVLAKLSSTGDLIWSVTVGGPGPDTPSALVVKDGVVAFTGSESQGITIGSTTTPSSTTTGFVAAYDASSGSLKWSRVLSGGTLSTMQGASAGTSLFIGGTFGGTVDFGSGGVASVGTSDAYIAQYDLTSGNLQRQDHWGTASATAGITNVSQDASGAIIALGQWTGSLTLAGSSHTNDSGNASAFAASFAGATASWFEDYVVINNGTGNPLLVPSTLSVGNGDIAFGGNWCNGELRMGAADITTTTGCTVQNRFRTGFLGRLKPDGHFLVSHSLGPIGWTDAVARTPDDRVFVTGKSQTSLSFETGGPLVGGGAYILALAPD